MNPELSLAATGSWCRTCSMLHDHRLVRLAVDAGLIPASGKSDVEGTLDPLEILVPRSEQRLDTLLSEGHLRHEKRGSINRVRVGGRDEM